MKIELNLYELKKILTVFAYQHDHMGLDEGEVDVRDRLALSFTGLHEQAGDGHINQEDSL